MRPKSLVRTVLALLALATIPVLTLILATVVLALATMPLFLLVAAIFSFAQLKSATAMIGDHDPSDLVVIVKIDDGNIKGEPRCVSLLDDKTAD
jgi:hypothetical protein